jgi:outer membrane protein TolC
MTGVLLFSLFMTSGTALSPIASPTDSMPTITLGQALERATALDPNYIAALNGIGDAEWGRRAARLAFYTPLVAARSSMTRASSDFFNIGTGGLASQIVDARLEASYDLFDGGSRLYELRQRTAELEAAEANEIQERFQTALLTESEYYDVIAQRELLVVAAQRLRRADEQLAIARARVLSGAAVQTDTLQLLLESTRARVELIRQEATLKVARLQLGRRTGFERQVDAAPSDSLPLPALPIAEHEAAVEAMQNSPRVLTARANERSLEAARKVSRSAYSPSLSLFGQATAFDDTFFPTATNRTLWGLQLSVPIWDGGQRELNNARARTRLETARAVRKDAELGVRKEAIEAYLDYNTARASEQLARKAVTVARENLRVQEQRYRSGATTIIDLIIAQVDLTEAEAGQVNARNQARLALAALEAVLGRRLFHIP